MCKRGDIYFVNCGCDTSSSLQCGVRPVLVVSNDAANAHSPVEIGRASCRERV